MNTRIGLLFIALFVVCFGQVACYLRFIHTEIMFLLLLLWKMIGIEYVSLVAMFFCLQCIGGDLSDRNDHGDLDHLFEAALDADEFRIKIEGGRVAQNIAKDEWVLGENIKSVAKIQNQDKIYLPVLINLVFIGFSGKGKYGLNISQPQLSAWMEHMTHDTSFTLVDPLKLEEKVIDDPIGHYRFFYDIFELDEKMDTVIADLLKSFMRKEERTFYQHKMGVHSGKDYHYIDGKRVGRMLQDISIGLNLNDTYTIFFFNLDLGLPEQDVYGYRAGFSQGEIAELQKMKIKRERDEALDHFVRSEDVKPERKKEGIDEKIKVRSSKIISFSDEWTKRFLAKQHNSITNMTLIEYFSEVGKNGGDEERHLLDSIISESSTLHEDCLVDLWTGSGRQMLVDLSAGPFEWGATTKGKGIKAKSTVPDVYFTMKRYQYEKPKNASTQQHSPLTSQLRNALNAERDVAMEFYNKYCSNMSKKPPFCRSMEQRIEEMGKVKSSADTKVLSAAVRDFGIVAADQRTDNDNHPSIDTFLSHLGSVIWKGITQAITPTSTLPRVFARDKVTFELYIITNHKAYKPTAIHNFDLGMFRTQLSQLKLPKQDYSFIIHRISMDEDPVISVAFSTALKSDMIGLIDPQGRFQSEERVYIDSVQFRRQLTLTSDILEKDEQDASKSLRIPIFLFSLDYSYPVLVDKYYQAQSLGSMVVAVQSRHIKWETSLVCNEIPVYWNLRNPTKATLSAVAQVLGGVNTFWLSSGEQQETKYQDWVWSVGPHPLSFTSHRSTFSAITIDAIHRNYIMNGLVNSIKVVTAANDLLHKQRTTPENFGAYELIKLEDLNHLHTKILRMRATIISFVSNGKLDKAVSLVSHLLEKSHEFAGMTSEVITTLATYECVRAETVDFLSPIMIALDVVIILLLVLLQTRKSKVKLN